MRRTPRETSESARRITRRGLFLGAAQVAIAASLAARMRFLQVNQADEFRLLAEENRVKFKLIPPARGRVFDRNGKVLADNELSYRIDLVPEEAKDVEDVVRRVAQLVELEAEDINDALEEIDRNYSFRPVTIAERVSRRAVDRVAANAPALPGISPEKGLSRIYPERETFAHVVGYVQAVQERNLKTYQDPPAVLTLPGFAHGQVGIENKMENTLRGEAGARRVEVNSVGREMRELGRREGTPGSELQLTVDTDLQEYTLARLGDESASVVVMDLEKGDLLAIASAPAFDPNLFVHGISTKQFKPLLEDNHRPLASKTVQDAYPPGSTFKMVTALAAMDAGLISPDETVYCPGHMEVGSRRFHCWKRAGHGHMNLETSLRESCDVYYYDLALKVGIERIAAMGRKLGLGEAHAVEMSAVTQGLMPDKAWKKRERGADWLIGDTVNASIGQGFVLTSPLHLAVMSARIATGRSIEPRLIKSVDGVETPSRGGTDLGLNENHLRQIRRAMYAVSNNRRGTAYKSRIIADDYRMAGKTGTAQVSSNVVNNKEVPWEQRDHALFVNFAPYEAPRIAVSVVVEHGGGGSTSAAPIARDVTLQALYGEYPPLSAYPQKDRSGAKALQDRLARERDARLSERSDRA